MTQKDATEKKEVPVEPKCPDCGSKIRHIDQYDRWYCNACKKYQSKDFKPEETDKEEYEDLWKEHLEKEFENGHLLPFIILNEALNPNWYWLSFLTESRDQNELIARIDKYFIAQKEDSQNELGKFKNRIVPPAKIQSSQASFRDIFNRFTYGLLKDKIEGQIEKLKRADVNSGKIYEYEEKEINPSFTYGMDGYKIKVQYINIPYVPRLKVNKKSPFGAN